jgi:hypothetical protein
MYSYFILKVIVKITLIYLLSYGGKDKIFGCGIGGIPCHY